MHNCPAHYQLIVTDWKAKQMTITEPSSYRAGTFYWVPQSKVHVQSRWAWFFGSVSKLLTAGIQFVYIWFISFHLNMICLSCFIYFGPRFCHISNTLQGLVKDFEAGCCSRVVWSACQRPGVALFHSSKALSSHCSLARCFRCALQKRVFSNIDSYVEASKWSLKRYAKL